MQFLSSLGCLGCFFELGLGWVLKGISEEDDVNVKKYLRGEAANLEVRIFQGFYHYNLST